MKKNSLVPFFLFLIAAFLFPNPANSQIFTYSGMCDGSAASAIDDNTFIVASDETKFLQPPATKGQNVLNIYEIGKALPKASIDLEPALKSESKNNEADIEGSARIGNRIFWITSHGLNSSGKTRIDRLNFFATDIANGRVSLASRNQSALPAYKNLLNDLIADMRYAKYKFADLNQQKIAPESGGINIEGLSATPNGDILIAFRSPINAGKAILALLKNPNGIIEGKPAKLGDPIELDLNGRGIRDIAFWPKENSYLIIAGSVGSSNQFSLYRWNGKADGSQKLEEQKSVDFTGLNPEGILIYPNGRIQVISDDGDVQKNGKTNKDLPDAERSFRSIWLAQTISLSVEK